MPAGRDDVIVAAPLDNVRHGPSIDLEVGCKVPAEIRRSDDNEATTPLSRGVAKRHGRKEDENQKKSADVAG
jgi:hypothetical protein